MAKAIKLTENAYFDALHYGAPVSLITFSEGDLFRRIGCAWVKM